MSEALQKWLAGDFEACLEVTAAAAGETGSVYLEILLIRARALLRLDRAGEALDELRDVVGSDEFTNESLTARMLQGNALVRMDDTEGGLSVLLAAKVAAREASPVVRSEIALGIALAYFGRRDLQMALLELNDVAPTSDIVHARAYEYRGWIASACAEYERAITMFQAALRRLQSCCAHDRFLEANCLQALAYLAVERFDRATWALVVEHRARIDWTAQGLVYPQFLIALCAANFAYDVDGDALAAAGEARFAEAIAPSDAYRARALCMRASIARYAGEAVAQRDHLQNAVEIFDHMAPAQLSGDERLVPLVIAEELANVGRAAEARSFAEIYEAHNETSSMLAITGDPRRDAYEKLVLGQLLCAEGDTEAAYGAFRAAFDAFRRVGYLRRSAMAALRMVRISPSEDFLWGHLESATATLAESSWIRAGIGVLRGHALRARLTPVQLEYLRLLCAGKTNPEIAQIRGRSVNTVRNQIVPLFEIFGVQSRSELVAECFRSDVLQDDHPAQAVLASR